MARFYSYKIWDIKRLTLRQLNAYLDNIQYVFEWSEQFNKPPKKVIPSPDIVKFAERCGVRVPTEIIAKLNKSFQKPAS